MPLNKIVLEKGFLDIIRNPPDNPIAAARKMAQVYADYAALAVGTVAGPAVFTGAEKATMAAVLAGGFGPNGTPSKAGGGLLNSIKAFWLTPPVVFPPGAASAFTGGPALGSCLNANFRNPRISAGLAAKKLANCFDLATRLVLITLPGPPFVAFVV